MSTENILTENRGAHATSRKTRRTSGERPRHQEESFANPTFAERVGSMLKLDFYRLFHTPLFYIMLGVAAIIPAMVLGMAGADTAGVAAGGVAAGGAAVATTPTAEITNAWLMIESTGGSAAGANPLDFAGYANINMLFIFAGLLMAIFIAHDYSSGFVKSIFTTHAKKVDYVISKTAIGVFSGAGMIITYVLGTVVAGMLTGKSFDVEIGGLILCLFSKAALMAIFCSLFVGISVFFKNRLWLTIVFTFLFGMMLYPAASVATLSSTPLTLLISLVAGAIGAVGLGAVSTLILNKRDLV